MNRTSTVLAVRGMTCPSCIHHVDQALRELDGVTRVLVRLREGTVTVEHDEGTPGVAAMVAALKEAGYEAGAAAA